jgi:hypothetical protein
MFGGCEEVFKPIGVPFIPEQSGSAGSVPGSTTLQVSELDKDSLIKNPSDPASYRLRIFSQSNDIEADIVTTPETFGLWPDKKLHVQGNVVATGSLDSNGFTDTVFIYYDKPLAGDFKFSARVRMTANAGTSTAKGVYIGAHASHTENGDPVGKFTKAAGMLFRTSNGSGSPAAVRFYYQFNSPGVSDPAFDRNIDWHAGQNGSEEMMTNQDWRREYIFEVARKGDEYMLDILNSKTFASESSNFSMIPVTLPKPNLLHPALIGGNEVFAGITLAGTSAEISQIRIWEVAEPVWDYEKDDLEEEQDAGADIPIFMTPRSDPAYVPATHIIVEHPRLAPDLVVSDGRIINLIAYQSSQLPGSGEIIITPSLAPAWRDDNIFFQWFQTEVIHPVSPAPTKDIFTIEGYGTPVTVHDEDGTLLGTTYPQGLIKVDWDYIDSLATNSGAGRVITGRFLIVARDLNLDKAKMKARLDWPLLQTLPEYYFEVRITYVDPL